MRVIIFLSSLLLLSAPASPQAPGVTVSGIARAQAPSVPLSRQAIEHRFESLHPTTRPNLHGAIPGSRVIAAHDARSSALVRRKQLAGVTSPLAGSLSGVLPGLEMRPALPAGSYPTSVVTGDFNRDGHQDFVVANGNDNDLWIYFGKGDGTFALPVIVPLTGGTGPGSLIAVDLRGNGILDLVVAEFGSSTIGVLLGNGDGTFASEQEYALPEPPGALVVADFNHDGKLDIAAAMVTAITPAYVNPGPPYLAMLAGNGDGTFANPIITYNWGFYSAIEDVDAADVNGDGLPDLLTTGPSELDNSTLYLNNGDGTFREGSIVVGNNFNAVVGGKLVDVNGDGCPDAVVVDLIGVVWIRLGDCAGNFGPLTSVPMGQANAAVRVADVNGDGHLDLVVSSEEIEEATGYYTAGDTVSVALGDGKGNFGLARIYAGNSEALSLALGDFKGNGRPDIVTADADTDSATVFPNDGNGGYGFPQGVYACQASQGTYICPDVGVGPGSGYTFADVNGDSKPDIFQIGSSVDIESSGSTYSYFSLSFLNDGSGRFGPSLASPFLTGATYMQFGDYKLGDFRNTGHQDLVAIGMNTQGSTDQPFIVFQPGNGDGTFGKATITPVSVDNGLIATGDFNGDGELDFVIVNGSQSHTLNTFLGNGDGTFRTGASINFSDTNNDIARVFASDFNRDGKLDVLVFATSNGYGTTGSAVWEFDGNGDGTFRAGRELFTGFAPMTLADINNDGHPDIVRDDFFPPSGNSLLSSPLFTNYVGQVDGSFQQVSSYSPYANGPVDPQPYIQFGDPMAVSLTGDYNGDGKIDEVAFQNGPTAYAQILMGNGDGSFTPTYDIFQFTPSFYPNYGHDLSGDGRTDMVGLDWGSGGMMVYRGAPAPALQMLLDSPEITGTQGCGTVYPDLVSTSSQSVALWSSVGGVSLPSSVTIPANAANATFCYTLASNFDVHQVFDINASLGGSTATAFGSLVYNKGFSESLSASSTAPAYAGQNTSPIVVTVTAEPGYTGTINLSCDGVPAGFSCQFISTQLNIAAGSPASTNLVISTPSGASASSATITILANDGKSIQRQTLSVPVATLQMLTPGLNTIYAEASSTVSASFEVFGIPPYSLSCVGLPAGATCSFDVTEQAYPSMSPVTVHMKASGGMAVGNYPFQLVVNSGGQSASTSATFSVFALSLQAPVTASDWAIPNSNATVTFPVQVSANVPAWSLGVGCTLDSSPVCQTSTTSLQPTTSSVSVPLSIPQNMAVGRHQLNVTASLNEITQNFTFPYYVADFSGSLSSSAVTFSAGSSTSILVNLTASTPFTGDVSLSCGASSITCTFSNDTVPLTGGAAQQVGLTLSAPSTAMIASPRRTLWQTGGPSSLPIFTIMLPFGIAIGLRRKGTLCALFAAMLVLSAVSCGGGSGSGRTSPSQYTVTVQASAFGVTHSVGTVLVTVNH